MRNSHIFEQFKTSIYKVGIIGNRVFEAKLELADNLFADKNILWNDAQYLNKPILNSLETNIEDGCNLNCRGCSHFSNLFKKGEKIPFETFCKDLKKISDNVFVYRFNMLGGEALLNERLTEYIEYAANIMPYTDIGIVTNGLLLLKQNKKFFEICKKYNISIGISGYKPTLAIKDKILQILDKNEVVYTFRDEVKDFGKNIDLLGQNEPQSALRRCRESRCHFMRNGKLYKCPFEALGNKLFTHYNMDIRIEGGIDLYQENLDWKKVVYDLHNNPVDACRYCGKEERIEWCIANTPQMEDWIIS